ncbi:global transcription factor group B1 [Zea mays]|uniref:Global transcription factor group B1 n=1 Tax=Zea mays TaxID=4577 RepID=A0A1D6M798_MAIZE|nr:global transcription factor group B1 [Zea mays]
MKKKMSSRLTRRIRGPRGGTGTIWTSAMTTTTTMRTVRMNLRRMTS